MNFRQLETFRWIARLGSFSAAAERVNATQSAVSTRIQELEQSLGVRLFDRSGRTAMLTLKGRALLPYAEQMISLASAIKSEIGARDTLSGIVRIGVVDIVAFSWFPALLRRLVELYPSMVFEIVADLTANLKRMVDSGQLDIVLAGLPHPSPTVISRPLGRVQMRWMAHRSLGLGGQVPPREKLSNTLLLSPSRESDLYWDTVRAFSTEGLAAPCVHTCNSLAVITNLVKSGFGIAVLPELLVRPQVRSGELEAIQIAPPVEHYDFFSMFRTGAADPTILAICQIAEEISTFERVSADAPYPA